MQITTIKTQNQQQQMFIAKSDKLNVTKLIRYREYKSVILQTIYYLSFYNCNIQEITYRPMKLYDVKEVRSNLFLTSNINLFDKLKR
jgi:hypothetical protein